MDNIIMRMPLIRPTSFDTALIVLAPLLLGYARSLRAPDPEDLAQQALLNALRSWQTFDGANMKAWLFCICRNCLADRRRSYMKRGATFVDLNQAAHLGVSPAAEELLALNDTLTSIDLLPEAQRETLILVLQGKTQNIVALELQVALGTIKSRVSRAREFLEARNA